MPSYIAGCDRQYQLKNAIDTMILDLLKNLDAGYDLNIDVVIEGVLNGITLETFNMLALNINKELKAQQKAFGTNNLFNLPYIQQQFIKF
ncbi:MAG: hypothetical protein QNL62_21540 [Gammaproteobacteria bacterium]|nr:hypothetical protein [Gammaproteobacteria bacterium]